MKKRSFLFGLCVIVFLCACDVQAKLCPFERVTGNSSIDIAGQIQVSISNSGSVYDSFYDQMVNKVSFKFTNTGSVDSSISEIYFYDGVLLNMYSIDDSYDGVNFENIGDKTNPTELPGYMPDYSLVSVLSATEATNPESKNGVKPGGWIKIGYTLLPGKTYQDLVDNLATQNVVIGVHVKSIEQLSGGTESDSFIAVPEPATMAILALGSLFLRRKK